MQLELSKEEMQLFLDYTNEMLLLFNEEERFYNADLSLLFQKEDFIRLKEKVEAAIETS